MHIPPDALVPVDRPEFAFLAPQSKAGRLRVRFAKIRKVPSYGFLVPAPAGVVEGQDCRELLGVEKYETPEDESREGKYGPIPPAVIPHYDIEGLRKYETLFNVGEPVVISEKIHGCLIPNTYISMADGSRKYISGITVGEAVLGVDGGGSVVAVRVTRKFDNGKSSRWLKIKGTRRGSGRGAPYFAITCTPNHKFWNPETKTYSLADELKIGDPVSLVRSEYGMTPLQEQVLLGKMLGDGSLAVGQYSAHMMWGHRRQDVEYCRWTSQALGDLDSGTEYEVVSGYGSNMHRRKTSNTAWIKDKFQDFVSGDRKEVPAGVADELTPIALAFWYMDDGSLTHSDGQEDRASFAVCNFSKESCEVLISGLSKLGISAVYYEAEGYSRLRINSDEAEKLFLLVAPYVPPAMQRKLPERYRGHPGWLPSSENKYKPALVTQFITSVDEDDPGDHNRHDIETETGNYFAHGVLVHNSNGKWAKLNGEFFAGSRNKFRRNSVWNRMAEQYRLAEILPEGLVLYGEVYGQGIQDLPYGIEGQRVAFFDIYDTGFGVWWHWASFDAFCRLYALPTVPTLYEGPWSPELAYSLAEGRTVLGKGCHVREGVVVKPVTERWDQEIGRVFLKLPGEGYLSR